MEDQGSQAHVHVLLRMAQLWGCEREDYMRAVQSGRPYLLCTHPVNLRAENLAEIARHPADYVVGDKTDGERRFLLLDTTASGAPYACIVDRKCRVTELPSVRVSDKTLYTGTLLDCEYVASDAVMVALDLVAVKGVTACRAPHTKRMSALHAIVPSIHTDGWRIVPKAWFPLSAIPTIPGTEGLIFVPASAGMRYGTCHDVFKWKAVHTIDFLLLPDRSLHLYKAGVPVDVTGWFLLDPAGLAATPGCHGTPRIIECSMLPPPPRETAWRLRYLKDRPDKAAPNDMSTLDSTMNSIRVQITRDALDALARSLLSR
jgi:hypothetical protein